MTDVVILQRLLLITLIAGAIGFERERHGRAAGFRTHILVGLGSCIVMLTGLFMVESSPSGSDIDPTRMAAQVISGIGFLGAGTILRSKASVRGLTTAASLWAVGGIGLAAGAGFVHGALFSGLLVMAVLFAFSSLEQAMRKTLYQALTIETKGSGVALPQICEVLGEYGVEIRDITVTEGVQKNDVRYAFQLKLLPDQPREEIAVQLQHLENIHSVRWS